MPGCLPVLVEREICSGDAEGYCDLVRTRREMCEGKGFEHCAEGGRARLMLACLRGCGTNGKRECHAVTGCHPAHSSGKADKKLSPALQQKDKAKAR